MKSRLDARSYYSHLSRFQPKQSHGVLTTGFGICQNVVCPPDRARHSPFEKLSQGRVSVLWFERVGKIMDRKESSRFSSGGKQKIGGMKDVYLSNKPLDIKGGI